MAALCVLHENNFVLVQKGRRSNILEHDRDDVKYWTTGCLLLEDVFWVVLLLCSFALLQGKRNSFNL